MTPLECSRNAALAYRHALARAAPDECAKLDAQARAAGHHWLTQIEIPTQADDHPELFDTLLTARDIENVWRIPATTIRTWANRGIIDRHNTPSATLYRLGDVLAAQSRHLLDKPRGS